MKRSFQLLLSLSVLLLLLVSTITFTFLLRRVMFGILVEQVVEDNRVMGEQVLDILTLFDYEALSQEQLVGQLQEICDQVMLPNEGFICVADAKGKLVAFPGLQANEEMSIARAEFISLNEDSKEPKGVGDLSSTESFEGFFINPDDGANDIIVSMPIQDTDLRILVHQNRMAVQERAYQITKPILLLMLAFSLVISLFIFIVVHIEVNRYESRLEGLYGELMESNKLLENANNQRMQLIHMLSHDLTNPIGAIKSVCELCLEDTNQERSKTYHFMVTESVNRSMGIINLVRKLEALETGKIELELSPINLKQCIEASFQVLEKRFRDKEVSFSLDVPEALRAEAEYHSLGNSVFANLLSNAVKFSPPGSEVRVKASEEDRWIRIAISDKGIGIPREMQQRLFDISSKTNRPGTAGEEGTGFGMPLVKSFVEHYGGEIQIQSTTREEDPENHGTTFTLLLRKSLA